MNNEKLKKRIALKVIAEDTNDEDHVETMNLLVKNFNKTLKRFNKKPYGGTIYLTTNEKWANGWKKPVKKGGMSNYVKRQSKNYYTTLTDDDSEGKEDQEEKVSNFVAFTTQLKPHFDDSLQDESEDEDKMTEEELLEDYKLLYSKWTELTMIYTKVETEKERLKE
ncbi:hypothetical protein LIER_02605 [Lithospermum erythrorhizon]|uniref:Uncharacterized protein n=1 Tax=Lithospermum erythrorhizon TaxID=34254 RepID=A0AAV3NUQ0_LITER